MLHLFLSLHRTLLISRCEAMAALRTQPVTIPSDGNYGIPPFLDQLIKTLSIEQAGTQQAGKTISGQAGGEDSEKSEMGETATLHGRDLSRRNFTVEQVVHDYGDLCQAITNLAVEQNQPIAVDEFRTMNRCLDNGIAMAVTEFNFQREAAAEHLRSDNVNERLGIFAHELRNQLNTATLALMVLKMGDVGMADATASVLDRSLAGMRNLINRSLAEVRIASGIPLQHALFSLAELIAEVRLSALLEAEVKGSKLVVAVVARELALNADRDLIMAAAGNLLQNAFKFSDANTEVGLKAFAKGDRILIEVEDDGPGLPPGHETEMFLPFKQGDKNKTGLGLGLTIARRSLEANHGTLRTRNKPGGGCIFTMDLPRHVMPE